jgi:hypothetical protein
MYHPRCTLALVAALSLGGAWLALRPVSPNLNAAQAAQPDEKKAQADPPTPSTRAFELAAALEKTVDYPGIDGAETQLGEILKQNQKKYNLTFDVNERAFKAELGEDTPNILGALIAKPTPVPPMKAAFKTVMRRILSRVPVESGVTYLIRKDCIEITTERAVRVELGMPPAKEGERLPPILTTEFAKQPLKGVLDRLGDMSSCTVGPRPSRREQGRVGDRRPVAERARRNGRRIGRRDGGTRGGPAAECLLRDDEADRRGDEERGRAAGIPAVAYRRYGGRSGSNGRGGSSEGATPEALTRPSRRCFGPEPNRPARCSSPQINGPSLRRSGSPRL